MKSILTSIVFLFLFSAPLSAQLKIAIKMGASASNLITTCEDNCFESFYLPAPSIGIVAAHPLSRKWDIQAELIGVIKGFNPRPDLTYSHLVGFLALPVLVSYEVAPRFRVLGGAELSYELFDFRQDFFLSLHSGYDKPKSSKIDFGLSAGLNYQLSELWSCDIRYTRGVSLRSLEAAGDKYKSFYLSFHRTIGKNSISE